MCRVSMEKATNEKKDDFERKYDIHKSLTKMGTDRALTNAASRNVLKRWEIRPVRWGAGPMRALTARTESSISWDTFPWDTFHRERRKQTGAKFTCLFQQHPKTGRIKMER